MLALYPSILEAGLAAEEPQLVNKASDALVPTTPDLLSPRTARNLPAVDVEPIRRVGPGSDVAVSATGLAAGDSDKFPRGGLCHRLWRQPESRRNRRTYLDHRLTCLRRFLCFWDVCRRPVCVRPNPSLMSLVI